MVDAIHDGTLKAMYLFGEEMSLVDSNANYVQERLQQARFLRRAGHLLQRNLPVRRRRSARGPSLEKEGTFTSTERRIQRLYQVFEPLGGSRPDWQIIQDVANRLGANWNYKHPSEIMAEIASLTPALRRRHLRATGRIQVAAVAGRRGWQRSAAALYQAVQLSRTARQGSSRFPGREPTEQPDAEFDLHLNNGRLLEHFHEGNMTYRVAGIHEKTPDTLVEVSPELAKERGIQSGTRVELHSRHGQVRVRALVTDRVRGKQLYMPMNSTESPVNRLTSSHSDPVTHTPAYKEAAVNMQVLPEVDESPLPRSNPPLRPSDAAARRAGRTQVETFGLLRSWNSAGPDSDAAKTGVNAMAQPIALDAARP